MNLNDINNLSVVELSPSLPFDDVETASFKHKKLCNEGVAEVNIYESDINLIKDLKLFFAGYLKLLYIELFEGESKDDLIKAYSNIISSYKVKFEMLEVRQVIENITVYLDSSCHYDDLQLKLSDIFIAYKCQNEQDFYFLASKEQAFIIECENE